MKMGLQWKIINHKEIIHFEQNLANNKALMVSLKLQLRQMLAIDEFDKIKYV